jgi:hypothetical protein
LLKISDGMASGQLLGRLRVLWSSARGVTAPPRGFRWHGVRARVFLVVCSVVERVASYVTRWKCPLCGRTFTWYPDFALPYKRYVLGFIQARCTGYVEDPACSYRSGVQEAGMPISYADVDSGTELQPSTLWRWESSLGSMPATACAALDLIKQKDPATGIFRALGTLYVVAHKYRSEGRRRVLMGCLELVCIDRVYAALFEVSVFPELAMGHGWG